MEEILKALATALAAELVKNEAFVEAIAAKAVEKVENELDIDSKVEDAVNEIDIESKVEDAVNEVDFDSKIEDALGDIDRRIEEVLDEQDIDSKIKDAMPLFDANNEAFANAVKRVIRDALHDQMK